MQDAGHQHDASQAGDAAIGRRAQHAEAVDDQAADHRPASDRHLKRGGQQASAKLGAVGRVGDHPGLKSDRQHRERHAPERQGRSRQPGRRAQADHRQHRRSDQRRAGDDSELRVTLGKERAGEVADEANKLEIRIKSVVREVMSGFPREKYISIFGKRSLRDMLDTQDLHRYAQCYEFARSLFTLNDGKIPANLPESLKKVYMPLDISKYLPTPLAA